jgi:hypothetical protein
VSARAGAGPRQGTVLDEFLALPDGISELIPKKPAARKAMLDIIDAKNGYLRGHGSTGGALTVALWLDAAKRHMLGLELDAECLGSGELRFYAPDHDGNWRPITGLVMPNLDAAAIKKAMPPVKEDPNRVDICGVTETDLVWELPRHATAISGNQALSGKKVIELIWDKQAARFHASPANFEKSR